MGSRNEADFIVIGAGMAGASAAAQLAPLGRVVVLEAEAQAGYHSTGRSAALFSEIYGNTVIRALTRASRELLFKPPDGFAAAPLVRPRGTLYFARPDQLDRLARFHADSDIGAHTVKLSARDTLDQVPAFKPGYLGGALLEPGSADIDVDALHQGFLRQARARGAQVHLRHAVDTLQRRSGRWEAVAGGIAFSAPIVVNAAGAWGDQIAQLAGVASLGLKPMRRTALLIDAPSDQPIADWPAAIDIDEQLYFKPDAGLLLLSPADEEPSPACDAQPEELDVATAVDRFEQVSATRVRHVRHRWAGLRVFSPDRSPVVGFGPQADGFFWLVGQGGYGIQTAAALGRAVASLAVAGAMPADLVAAGVQAAMLSPARFDS